MPDAVVITVSDRRSAGDARDDSGPEAVRRIESLEFRVTSQLTVPDEIDKIAAAVTHHLGTVALIVTTGGTGIGARDVTPEALQPLFDRDLPGFGEIMRSGSYSKTPLSIISRGGAGVARGTLIVMLPGSPKAVRECLELVGPAMRHVVRILAGEVTDCTKDRAAL